METYNSYGAGTSFESGYSFTVNIECTTDAVYNAATSIKKLYSGLTLTMTDGCNSALSDRSSIIGSVTLPYQDSDTAP